MAPIYWPRFIRAFNAAGFTALVLAGVCWASTANASTCSRHAISATAAEVRASRANLDRLIKPEVDAADGPTGDVSVVMRRAIEQLKNRTVMFGDAYMACAALDGDPAMMAREMAAQLALKSADSNAAITVNRWRESGNLIGIVSGIDIPCGEDAILIVFKPEDGRFKDVLRWRSKPYKTVAGGFGAFDYVVSPSDVAGHFYVVTKSIAPWCSSTWSDIRYAALRPGHYAARPIVVHQGDDFMWWGNDDYGTLLAKPDAFEVRFHSSSIDAGVHNRVRIRRYSIIGDRAERIQPVAVSPRDFVDEWIVSSWRDASSWTAGGARQSLAQMHNKLHKISASTSNSFEFQSATRCSGGADQFEIGLSDEKGASYFFRVSGLTVFSLTQVSRAADRDCAGPDILATMDTK